MLKLRGYTRLSDEELLAFLKASDSAAFSEIFKRYRKLLFLYASRRVADKEQAKDLIHDAFASLWEKRESTCIGGALLAFLLRVVKNKILDHYRHVKVSQRYIDNFNSYLLIHCDADHLLRHNELRLQIEKEIAALPEKMRTVFELSRKQHLNRKEIASYLNIPEENVKSTMRRTLSQLRATLKYQINLQMLLLIVYLFKL